MEQDHGASAEADRAATPSEPSQEVSGKAGIPCAFTPGPWELKYHGEMGPTQMYWANETVSLCVQNEADARLIAAAPELFHALQMCLIERSDWIDEARAAIAKARGKQVSA